MKQTHDLCAPMNFPGKAFLLLVAIASCFALPVNADDNSLEALQASARKWIDIRLETTQMQSDWTWQRDLLESTRDTLQYSIKQLEAEEALLEARTASDREKLAEKRREVEAQQARLAEHARHNEVLLKSIQAMRPSLPPRLSDSLDLAYTSLSNADLPTGERMQLMATILNRCLQFNNSITYSEEIIPINGETRQRVMSVLYWGLGQAYALDRANDEAYVGRPGADHWEWTLSEGAGPEIRQLIEIFQEHSDPALVPAPVQVNLTNMD